MDALHLHVAVAGRAVAVVERDGTHDPTTGRVLTGSWLWDFSLVLASHLAADASARLHLRGATVLELGAGGTGLPGTRPSPASAPHAACSRTCGRCCRAEPQGQRARRRAGRRARAPVGRPARGPAADGRGAHVGRVLRPGHAGDGGHAAGLVEGRCRRRRHGRVGGERGAGQHDGLHGRAAGTGLRGRRGRQGHQAAAARPRSDRRLRRLIASHSDNKRRS